MGNDYLDVKDENLGLTKVLTRVDMSKALHLVYTLHPKTLTNPLLAYNTTLQSIMNAKLSKHGFWHCHENGLIKTIQTIPHNL